ncbi:hotdog family protein [uncultured Methylophaga sp.]|uniref:hotdog family protein n=1 Tax=uncultured Methylophaga sp. TaxID=285271 RepID=UPI0026330E7C|nr:hotdog family protein [uncultured Methylophaga sp.]
MSVEFDVADLVPHSGTMSLLSRITAYGEDWLEAEVDIHESSLFAEADGVPAWVGLEYLAQTIAAYAGLQERKKHATPKIGFLLGTRRYEVSQPFFASGLTLIIRVRREMVADNGLHVFQGCLTGHQVEATANLNVFQPEDATAFMKEAKL